MPHTARTHTPAGDDRLEVVWGTCWRLPRSSRRRARLNTAEGWSRDVTEDIAREMIDQASRKAERLSKSPQAFVEWATGDEVPANLMDRS